MINLIDHYYNGEKLYQKTVQEVLDKFKLTYMEFSIIIFLYNNKSYDTAAQIIKYRHLTKSHVSTSIKALINDNYLEGFFNDNDHKTIHLKLTEKSIPVAKLGVKKQQEYLNLLTYNFSKDERKLLREFFYRIDTNLNESLDEKGDKNERR